LLRISVVLRWRCDFDPYEITPEVVNVEFLRVSYDVKKAAQAIVLSGLPVYFAERRKEAK